MERPGSVVRELHTKEAVLEFRLVFAKVLLQLERTESMKEVQNIIPLVSDANFDADELRRHVRKIDGCKRTVHDSRDKELAGEGLKNRDFEK